MPHCNLLCGITQPILRLFDICVPPSPFSVPLRPSVPRILPLFLSSPIAKCGVGMEQAPGSVGEVSHQIVYPDRTRSAGGVVCMPRITLRNQSQAGKTQRAARRFSRISSNNSHPAPVIFKKTDVLTSPNIESKFRDLVRNSVLPFFLIASV